MLGRVCSTILSYLPRVIEECTGDDALRHYGILMASLNLDVNERTTGFAAHARRSFDVMDRAYEGR
jgi:hypothetical protein